MTADRPAAMTAAEYLAYLATAKQRSKYGAVPVRDPIDGYFASTGEYERWGELKILRDQGVIRNLRRQVRYRLEVNGLLVGHYTADSVYEERGDDGTWAEVVEDFKGGPTRTEAYVVRRNLMLACHGITIRETGR
jgi:hypothetical protein